VPDRRLARARRRADRGAISTDRGPGGLPVSGVGALEPTDGHRRPFEVMCEVLAKGAPTQGGPIAAEVKEGAKAFVEVYLEAGRDRVMTDAGLWMLTRSRMTRWLRSPSAFSKSGSRARTWRSGGWGTRSWCRETSNPIWMSPERCSEDGDGPALPR
jgi:hypothetical protein